MEIESMKREFSSVEPHANILVEAMIQDKQKQQIEEISRTNKSETVPEENTRNMNDLLTAITQSVGDIEHRPVLPTVTFVGLQRLKDIVHALNGVLKEAVRLMSISQLNDTIYATATVATH